jgi:hypothetical protein
MKSLLFQFVLTILLLTFFSFSAFSSSQKLIVRGSIKNKTVGTGMSGGITSYVTDFKQIGLVINHKDTLRTRANEAMEFEFPPIKSSDVFQVLFFYEHSNPYLNRNLYFFANRKQTPKRFNLHRDEYNTPQLSIYSFQKGVKTDTLVLEYGLFCYVSHPVEPAGLHMYDYPSYDAAFTQLILPFDKTIYTRDKVHGISVIFPRFGFQMKDTMLTPVYTGFSFKTMNLSNDHEKCSNNFQPGPTLPCDLFYLVQEIHQALQTTEARFEQVMLAKALNVYFEPQIMLRVKNDSVEAAKKRLDAEIEPPMYLRFYVQNLSSKTIYAKASGVAPAYNASINTNEIKIARKERVLLTEVRFSMDNPKNFKAPLAWSQFPSTFLDKLQVGVGKRRVPIPVSSNWVVEQKGREITYTLLVGFD